MGNPLSQFFEVDERTDGVYIKVNQSHKDSVDIGKIEKALRDVFVINYDISTIRDVITRASGEFERIGPPFENYDVKFDSTIAIKGTPLKATMRISSESIVAGIKPTENMIYYALQRHGIKVGIKKEGIREFMNNAAYDQDIVIADGIPPENGIDAKIDIEVNLNPDSAPKVDEFGRTNYRDIKTFAVAKAGQVLAKRTPPMEGKSGKSVYGEDIKSYFGQDAKLPAGKNTEISKDGLWLCATKEGIVYLENSLICVGEILTIPGDVDFSVGNIKYTGDILIKGSVRPGFVIETEGNIDIEGEVESAKIISRKGFVVIGRGVIGRDDTEIYGAGGVTVSFAQGSVIKTDGKLTVEKYILHCNLTCSILESNKASSSVIGGKITIYDHALMMNVGNDGGVETDIFLVDKNRAKAKEKLAELADVKGKIAKQLEPVSRELKAKSQILKRAGDQATVKQRQELKKWVDTYNSLSMKVKYIEKKESEITEVMNSPANYGGFIKVHGTIHPGVKLDMYGVSHKAIGAKMTNKVFRLVDNMVQAEG